MIRLHVPFTDGRELDAVAQVLATGYLTQGPRTAEFERKFAAFIGSRHAFAMTSCTTALHLALVVADVEAGDEVLVPDFTFPATANVVVQLGAVPVLVDIDLDTFTVNQEDFARKITPRTKAAIPVHTFGCSADMSPIMQIARQAGIAVIEDAACAVGTTYNGRFCGTFGDLGCFSFHPRKVITTGEGGMITTDNDDLARRIQLLRNHGGVRVGGWYEFEAAGFNYRLSDVQGAIGVAQMDKLPQLMAGNRAMAVKLRNRLATIPGIRPPAEPSWGGHIYQSFVVLADEGLDRDRLITFMREHGVETTLGTYALHDQPFFQREFGYRPGQLPRSHAAFTRTITLPLYPQLTEVDLDIIATALAAAVSDQRDCGRG